MVRAARVVEKSWRPSPLKTPANDGNHRNVSSEFGKQVAKFGRNTPYNEELKERGEQVVNDRHDDQSLPASTVSQIIEGYIYSPNSPISPEWTPLTDYFNLPRHENDEPVDDMIRAIERVLNRPNSVESLVDPSFNPKHRYLAAVAAKGVTPLNSAVVRKALPPLPQMRTVPTATAPPAPLKRESSTSRKSKFSRLTALRVVENGNPVVALPGESERSNPLRITIAEHSPIDWLAVRNNLRASDLEPMSAITPLSCITDAFSGDANWLSMDRGDDSDYEHNKDDPNDKSIGASSCTHTSIYDDCLDIDRTWDGVTIIDSGSQASEAVRRVEDFSQEDFGKEVAVDTNAPIISCRIDSVITLNDFPEFMPTDDSDSEDSDFVTRSQRNMRRSDTGTIEIAPPKDYIHQLRAANPLSISRETMKQDWTETPPIKLLDMAKLESMAPPRIPTPASRNSMSGSPLPWLAASSSSSSSPRPHSPAPANADFGLFKHRKSPDMIKRSRSPWRLW